MRWLAALLVLVGIALLAWSRSPERARAVRTAEGPAEPREGEGRESPGPGPETPSGEATAPERSAGESIPPAPPDPVEEGPCTLELALVDRDSGAPVKAGARLYRLDVPGNEHWTRGDQLQRVVDVGPGGAVVPRLPAGWYRIHCLDQPQESDDPEAFLVSGSRTRRTLAVPMPRSFEAWLVVVDEGGTRCKEGRIRGGGRSYTDRDAEPAWRTPRTLREPDRYFSGRGFGAGASGGRSVRRLSADDGRFRLGRYREDSRRRNSRVGWRWQEEGRTEVRVRIGLRGAREREFFGVSVPIEPIRRSVLLPDGGLAIERGARIEVWHDAVEGRPVAPGEAVLRVRVVLKGHKKLEFTMRADAAPTTRTMEAAAQG